jgi:hypothetical protein
VVLKIFVTLVFGLVGGTFGWMVSTGYPGIFLAGLMSGLAVGYAYAHLILNVKSRWTLVRIWWGSLYGLLAGGLSGGYTALSMSRGDDPLRFYVALGAIYGALPGLALGFVFACIIAFLRLKQ